MREYITEDQIAQMRLSTPIKFGPIGEDVFYRTYSRTLKNGNQEDWYDTCARVINGNLNFVDGAFIEKGEAEKLYKLFLGMEAMPAGRHLWATGIQHDKQFLNNCHAASFTDRFSEHFEHTFMRLMEGGGVGANYSKLFINSNQGKAWVPKTKVNLHLICNPNHADFNLDVEFVAGKKLLFKELLSNQYDWSWQGDTNPKAVYLKVEDSREGWCSSLISLLEYSISDEEEIDLIVDVSNVRPYGALLRGFGGKSSGPGALMVMLMKTTDLLNSKLNEKLGSLDHMWIDHYIAEAVVAGGARRSARLSLIHWKDSEIFDFIKCKQGSIAHWTSNISVVIDNKFFTALRRDDEHALEVYSQVCKGMLNNGEPGFINASQHLLGEAPNVEYYGSNPCVSINTWIMTTEGPFQVRDLVGKPFEALINGKPYSSDNRGFFCTDYKPLYSLVTNRGPKILATEDHPILVYSEKSKSSKWVKLKDIKIGDRIVLHNHKISIWGDITNSKDDHKKGWLIGSLLGDGNITKAGVANLDFWGAEKSELNETAVSYLESTVGRKTHKIRGGVSLKYDKTRTGSIELAKLAESFGVRNGSKLLNTEVEFQSSSFYEGFLRGWFDADGSVQGTQNKGVSVRLSSIHKTNLETAQRMLLRLGIASTIYPNRKPAGFRTLPNGKGGTKDYFCRANHELVISGSNLLNFSQRVGFETKAKADRLNLLLTKYKRNLNTEKWLTTVTAKTQLSAELVYDCHIPNAHCFDGNGMFVHNCSEISFVEYPDLKCFEVCCLAHINLDRVENPDEAFRLISRFLVRATFAPVADPRQAASIARNRRIGVGFLGLHNWLVKRGLKFSDASKKGQVIEFFHRMYKIVDETVRIYCKELRIPECIKKTTCAPTGSIGQLTGSSTGCQPVFSKFYIRRVRYSNSDDMLEKLKEKGYEIVPDVYAMNTSVVKYICIDPIYDQAVQYFKDLNIEEKYAREEAIALVEDQSELSLEDFLEMQAMLQKDFVDNSISMTINVDPKRYKIEDLMGVLKHYLPRLKGTTIFPEFGMELMPYERITYDEFLKYKDSGYPVEMGQAEQLCLNGSCPIR